MLSFSISNSSKIRIFLFALFTKRWHYRNIGVLDFVTQPHDSPYVVQRGKTDCAIHLYFSHQLYFKGCFVCSQKRKGSSVGENNTEPEEDLHTCSLTVKNVYFCVKLLVCVCIFILCLWTITCMLNLKGKCVRFLFETFITASFYYPKCYLTFFNSILFLSAVVTLF